MGTTSEKLSYLNTTKTKIKEALNLGGANLTNETFREYADEIKERYLYFMNNGLEVVWENWDKVSGTGTSLTLNNTVEAPMKLEYKGNTSQSGTPTPSSPVDIKVVSGDNSIVVSNSDNTESTSYPISLGDIELCKIGTYQDKIFKNTPNTTDYDSNLEDNVWYVKKEIGKVVLNGSESWYQWGADTFYITRLSTIRTGLSNYYKYNTTVTGASQLSNGEFFIHDNTNNNVVIFRNTSITTIADFKTWLGTHNTEVYYVLSTPTYETITDTTLLSQLEAVKKSVEGQTNISQVNDGLPFELSVSALGEM